MRKNKQQKYTPQKIPSRKNRGRQNNVLLETPGDDGLAAVVEEEARHRKFHSYIDPSQAIDPDMILSGVNDYHLREVDNGRTLRGTSRVYRRY